MLCYDSCRIGWTVNSCYSIHGSQALYPQSRWQTWGPRFQLTRNVVGSSKHPSIRRSSSLVFSSPPLLPLPNDGHWLSKCLVYDCRDVNGVRWKLFVAVFAGWAKLALAAPSQVSLLLRRAPRLRYLLSVVSAGGSMAHDEDGTGVTAAGIGASTANSSASDIVQMTTLSTINNKPVVSTAGAPPSYVIVSPAQRLAQEVRVAILHSYCHVIPSHLIPSSSEQRLTGHSWLFA